MCVCVREREKEKEGESVWVRKLHGLVGPAVRMALRVDIHMYIIPSSTYDVRSLNDLYNILGSDRVLEEKQKVPSPRERESRFKDRR